MLVHLLVLLYLYFVPLLIYRENTVVLIALF